MSITVSYGPDLIEHAWNKVLVGEIRSLHERLRTALDLLDLANGDGE